MYWICSDGDGAVLGRILGAWIGIIVCDGAPVFQMYVMWWCWAPILSKAKFLARIFPDNGDVLHMSARLHKMFHDAKAYEGGGSGAQKKRYEFTGRVRGLVDYHVGDSLLARFGAKLDNLRTAYSCRRRAVGSPANNPA